MTDTRERGPAYGPVFPCPLGPFKVPFMESCDGTLPTGKMEDQEDHYAS